LEVLEAREANPDVRLIYLLRNRRVSTAEVSGKLNSKSTKNQRERNRSAASGDPELLMKQSPREGQ
jgi:hypothetical protein